jgi:hypothetical protein
MCTAKILRLKVKINPRKRGNLTPVFLNFAKKELIEYFSNTVGREVSQPIFM